MDVGLIEVAGTAIAVVLGALGVFLARVLSKMNQGQAQFHEVIEKQGEGNEKFLKVIEAVALKNGNGVSHGTTHNMISNLSNAIGEMRVEHGKKLDTMIHNQEEHLKIQRARFEELN